MFLKVLDSKNRKPKNDMILFVIVQLLNNSYYFLISIVYYTTFIDTYRLFYSFTVSTTVLWVSCVVLNMLYYIGLLLYLLVLRGGNRLYR